MLIALCIASFEYNKLYCLIVIMILIALSTLQLQEAHKSFRSLSNIVNPENKFSRQIHRHSPRARMFVLSIASLTSKKEHLHGSSANDSVRAFEQAPG